ncbi:MAG TPA: nucleotide exchange factor GrpE [Lachnospiraceae bacterium]|nr:nucleotide exchange factor GrpE [Lachnospiraceae bacterium]
MAEDRNKAADAEENLTDAAKDMTEETLEGQAEDIPEEGAAEEQNADDAAQADGAEEPKEPKEPTQGEKIKKFFAKKKDVKDEKIEELTDQLKRQMAEFDNYRKRTDKEKASMYVIGAKEIVEKLLPVVDSFERGLSTATGEQMEDPFVDGMNKVYKQMLTALDELGVKPIEALGCEFNPDFHNAVMHVEDEEAGENTIVEEFQKGYTYKDFVVRHSMVKVAN